jgi:hypothetical protein
MYQPANGESNLEKYKGERRKINQDIERSPVSNERSPGENLVG